MKHFKPAVDYGYCLYQSRIKSPAMFNFSWWKKSAISKLESDMGESWADLYKKGWRCMKVTFVPTDLMPLGLKLTRDE